MARYLYRRIDLNTIKGIEDAEALQRLGYFAVDPYIMRKEINEKWTQIKKSDCGK
jgi:hypothetical protein